MNNEVGLDADLADLLVRYEPRVISHGHLVYPKFVALCLDDTFRDSSIGGMLCYWKHSLWLAVEHWPWG